jgi:hypothetical protein
VRKIKTATVIALAMIVLLLGAVAYAAATQWGVFSFLEYRYDKQMPPEAKNALQTNVPQVGGDEADVAFKVREALYDGKQLEGLEYGWPANAYCLTELWAKDWLIGKRLKREKARELILHHCEAHGIGESRKKVEKALFGRA